MKFIFNKEISKIKDYFIFPRLLFRLEEDLQEKDSFVDNVIKDDYNELIEKASTFLETFSEEINQFYYKDIYSKYDFVNILLTAYPEYEYKDVHKYLDDLLAKDPKDFKNKIIKTLIISEDDENSPTTFDESQATNYINGLKIDSANKWNLFMMIQNPHSHLEKFVALLKKVEPIFNSSYKSYEKRIEEVGKDLVKRLSVNPNKVFKEITYDTVTYDFSDIESYNLYISFVMPYSIRFFRTEVNKIVWGLELEYTFKKLHELNEDKLTSRVKIFKALGDKTRYEVLRLVSSGVSSIKKIAEELEVSSATISYHMNEFLNSGIIYLKKTKKQKLGYRVDYKRLNEVFEDFKKDLKF